MAEFRKPFSIPQYGTIPILDTNTSMSQIPSGFPEGRSMFYVDGADWSSYPGIVVTNRIGNTAHQIWANANTSRKITRERIGTTSVWSSWDSFGKFRWEVISTSQTLEHNVKYFVDTTSTFSLIAPLSPLIGDFFELIDTRRTFHLYNCVLTFNGEAYNGDSGTPSISFAPGVPQETHVKFVYTGALMGWKLTKDL